MNVKRQSKYILAGFIVAIFMSFIGSLVYMSLLPKYTFERAWLLVKEGRLYGQMLALGSLPNLLIFFVCMKTRKENFAMGILGASLLTALVVVICNLLE